MPASHRPGLCAFVATLQAIDDKMIELDGTANKKNLGANAVLELGPGGGNLMGAMRGARVISSYMGLPTRRVAAISSAHTGN